MAGLRDLEKNLREGKLSRRELLGTAALAGAGAAAASMFPNVLPALAASKFPKRRVMWLTMVRAAFFVPCMIGEREAAEMFGWETQFNAPEQATPDAIMNIFMNYIEQKPDAIAFAYLQSKIYDSAIKKAKEAGIFLISWNTEAHDDRVRDGIAFVGQNMDIAGRANGMAAAQNAEKLTGKKEGKIVITNEIPGHAALEARVKGTAAGVEDYNAKNGTKFTTEALATSMNDTEFVSKVEAKYTSDEKNIVGFAGVGSMTYAIGMFFKARNLAGKLAGGGFDLNDPTLMAIKDGRLQWTVGQDPYSQGFVTSCLLWTALERQLPPADYYTAAEIVDASKVDLVIKREALWKDRAKEVGF